MKHMRKIALILAVVMLAAVFPLQGVSAAVIGEKLGNVLNSDIKAFINGERIPSYNIANKTVVVAEDLANYGFDVAWNSSSRSVSITLNSGKKVTPLKAENNTKTPGTVAFPYVYTDIVAYVNGKKVDSYNIQGKTVILFESLSAYGTFAWDGTNRHSKFTTSSSSSSSSSSGSSGKKVGDVLGNVLNSNIKAFINGERIPSYNIANKTVVVAEDLSNYGFDVSWNDKNRSLYITLNAGKKTSALKTEDNTKTPGTAAFPYVYTDIVTYVNNKKVDSFNVQGKTAVYFESLADYGIFEWDGKNSYSMFYTNFSISGKVTEVGSSSALAGVQVTLKDKSGKTIETMTTASDGSYTFADVAPGIYTVEFALSEYSSQKASVTVSKTDVTGQNVKMNKEKRTVSGKIFDGNSSTGLAGVSVSLKKVGGGAIDTTYTNSDGSYEFSGVAIGTYTVEASMKGYKTTPTSAFSMGTTDIGNKNINLPVSGVVISGIVYTENSAGKISGATVILKNNNGIVVDTTTANTDGSYSFIDVETGYYTIQAEATGYVTDSISTFSVAYTDISGKNFTLKSSGYTITGYIYDSDSYNNSVSGATVTLKNSSGSVIQTVTSQSNGYYTFTGLSSSSNTYYTVSASISTSSSTSSGTTSSFTVTNNQSRNVYISKAGANCVSGYITYNSSSSITITSATMNGSSYGTLNFNYFSNNSIISNAQYQSGTTSGSYVYIYFTGSISSGYASNATVTAISSNSNNLSITGTVREVTNSYIRVETSSGATYYFYTSNSYTSTSNIYVGNYITVYYTGTLGGTTYISSINNSGGNSSITGTVREVTNSYIRVETSSGATYYFYTSGSYSSTSNIYVGNYITVYYTGTLGNTTYIASINNSGGSGDYKTGSISGTFDSYSYNGSYYSITLTNTGWGTITFNNVSSSQFNSMSSRVGYTVTVYFNGYVYYNDASQASVSSVSY